MPGRKPEEGELIRAILCINAQHLPAVVYKKLDAPLLWKFKGMQHPRGTRAATAVRTC